MTGREALKELARLERAAITGPPPPPTDTGQAAAVERLVDEMTAWDAAYKRERRQRDAKRRGMRVVAGKGRTA